MVLFRCCSAQHNADGCGAVASPVMVHALVALDSVGHEGERVSDDVSNSSQDRTHTDAADAKAAASARTHDSARVPPVPPNTPQGPQGADARNEPSATAGGAPAHVASADRPQWKVVSSPKKAPYSPKKFTAETAVKRAEHEAGTSPKKAASPKHSVAEATSPKRFASDATSPKKAQSPEVPSLKKTESSEHTSPKKAARSLTSPAARAAESPGAQQSPKALSPQTAAKQGVQPPAPPGCGVRLTITLHTSP